MKTHSNIRQHKTRRAACAAVESLEQRTLLSATLAFAQTVNFGAGFVAGGFDAADFNSDSVGDLVVSDVSNAGGTPVDHLIEGSATGTASLAGTVSLPSTFLNQGPVLFADVNGDGKPDVVQTMETTDHTAGQIVVELNNGDGTFLNPGTPSGGSSNMAALVVGDFNNDKNADIVDSALPSNGTFVNDVLLGNGADGTFHVSPSFSSDHPNESLVAADFNGDGNLDLATPYGIQFGKGDGTFNTLVAYPAGNGLNRIIVGDFNNDNSPDIALVGGSDQTSLPATITLLFNDTHGNFTSSTVSIGDGLTDVVGLTAADMDGDKNTDLVATLGAHAGAESNSIAILDGHGDGTFSPARFFATSAGSGPVIAAPFLNKALPDVAVLDLTNNQVLLFRNTSVSPTTVTVSSNFNNSLQGEAVQLTATIAGGTSGTPTGTVTFLDGTNVLGSAPLVGTTATFSTAALTVGDHTITARYNGDANFQSATSSSITQTVQATSSATHSINVRVTQLVLPSPAVPGDKGSIKLLLGNFGSQAAKGLVSVSLFASANGAVDTSSILIPAPSLANRSINLGSGKTQLVSTTFTLPVTLAAGTYQILATVDAGKGLSAADIAKGFGASNAVSVVQEFGAVGARHNVKFQETASDKGVLTFSLTGPGTGTLTSNGAIITINGSTSNSHLSITKKGGTSKTISIAQLVVNGSLAAFGNSRDALTVALSVTGNLPSLTLGDVGAARMTILGKAQTRITLGDVTGATLLSSAPISALSVKSWSGTTPGTISAPAIGTINSPGAFDPVVALHAAGSRLRSANIGSSNGGLWGVAGSVGKVICKGGWTNGGILAGTDFGADNTKGGTDDRFFAATLEFVEVTGAVSQCFFAAGLNPVDGTYLNGNDVLIPNSSVGKAIFLSTVGTESRILAAHIPRQVQIAKTVVNTGTDARFKPE